MKSTRTYGNLDIAAFNGKHVQAYEYAFRTYFPALRDFTGRLVGTDGAQDLVDDLFLKLWKGKQQFNDEDHLKAFLYHSIKNAALDQLKKSKRAESRHLQYEEWQEKDEANYLAGIIRAEVIMELHKAIAELPREKGRIIQMTYLDGKTNQETADELGISIQTVKNQKLRGLALLRRRLPEGIFTLLLLFSTVK